MFAAHMPAIALARRAAAAGQSHAMDAASRIAVIGAGAWGTALAQVLAAEGRPVALWARRDDVVAAIRARGENTPCLPGVPLAPGLAVSTDLAATLAGSAIAILAVPAQAATGLAAAMRRAQTDAAPIVIAAKGFDRATGALLTATIAAAIPGCPLAVLSGPSFAADMARGLPTAVVLAAETIDRARSLAARLATPKLRIYASDDPIGVQVGGALKNVMAIACGIVAGRGLGDSARAALLTRGLAEIARLGAALGGRPTTFMGLSGLGDLALTCGSHQSRNFALGAELGRGATLASLLAGRRSVVEGVETAAAAAALARRRGVDMPIVAAVAAVLHHGADIDGAIAGLLSRPLKEED
jgi:glycerol-3-phosphate dehydrogenase (NAD(P)+)